MNAHTAAGKETLLKENKGLGKRDMNKKIVQVI